MAATEEFESHWEALAEMHFTLEDELTDDNYIYSLFSRVFIRDGVKYVDEEILSDSDQESRCDSKKLDPDHSHVHIPSDTGYKKPDKDEGASCYGTASYTDNYCSTDEYDQAQALSIVSNTIQPSDSGADLTYQNCYLETDQVSHNLDTQKQLNTTIQDSSSIFEEDYLSECTWDKFWSVNGERLIWASWIQKYSDYINPDYLNENNDLCLGDDNIPKKHLADQICEDSITQKIETDDNIRERKFSYDSKVNPYKKNADNEQKFDKNHLELSANDAWEPIRRRRSCSEHDRMLSPRTVTTIDSMTNITKMTLSSYDVTSSHVTSESSPTDDYSVSSSTSDDTSNDQTRIANIDDAEVTTFDEMDTETYWQFLWKKHFGEQYALHSANYTQCQNAQKQTVPSIVFDELKQSGEENTEEAPAVVEVSHGMKSIKLTEKTSKQKKKKKKYGTKKVSDALVQSYLTDSSLCDGREVTDAGENQTNNSKDNSMNNDTGNTSTNTAVNDNCPQSNTSSPFIFKGDDGEDPPEERPIILKRSHTDEEVDELLEEDNLISPEAKYKKIAKEKILKTLNIMGYYTNLGHIQKGEIVYRKRNNRLRCPRPRRHAEPKLKPKSIYFDVDGRAVYSTTTGEVLTSKTDPIIETQYDSNTLESVLPSDAPESPEANDVETPFRKSQPVQNTMPAELVNLPEMHKYWDKRHRLFNRFDQGIRMDIESWFSVTPEKVAQHIAQRCKCDVIVDGFCGAGGNAIQFAFLCNKVIAIDIDPVKINLARHNAAIYEVADRIEFIVGDYFQLAPALKADVVFLSPPWGGPNYTKNAGYDLETMLEPRPLSQLMETTLKITNDIAIFLPRNSKIDQLIPWAVHSTAIEVEQNRLWRDLIGLTVYFGDLVARCEFSSKRRHYRFNSD